MKTEKYILFLKKNKNKIIGADKLIQKLQSNSAEYHIFHADCVRKIFESKKYEIVGIEKEYYIDKNHFDVDIELRDIKLNKRINIQIWHGASVSTHNFIRGKVSDMGGVETDWEQDKKVLIKKLEQLPPDNFGLLLCFNYNMGPYFLPEWVDKMPKNKALAEAYGVKYGDDPQYEARLHFSQNFKYANMANEVLSTLGIPIKHC